MVDGWLLLFGASRLQAWAERDLTTLDIKEYYQERRLKELQLCGPLTEDELSDGSGGRRSRDLDW